MPFTLVDVESVPGAERDMISVANGVRKVPTIVIDALDTKAMRIPAQRYVLVEPSGDELTEALRRLKETTAVG